MRVLLIKDNLVENVIFADSVVRAQSFYPGYIVMEQTEQLNSVGPGWIYDISVNEFSPPVVVELPQDRKVTRLAFLNRFTDSEAISIDLLSIGATVQAATMRRYMQKVNAATFIDLDSEETRMGVMQLEALGVIAQGRALEILDNPVQQNERPSGVI